MNWSAAQAQLKIHSQYIFKTTQCLLSMVTFARRATGILDHLSQGDLAASAQEVDFLEVLIKGETCIPRLLFFWVRRFN